MVRTSTAGRPKCDEFEEEVMAKCDSLLDEKRRRASSLNDYSYAHVKRCAAIVMDGDYWDNQTRSFVKKWKLNRTTCSLCFSNKWVHGVLRRQLLKKTSLEASSSDTNTDLTTHDATSSSDVKAADAIHTHDFDHDLFDDDDLVDRDVCGDLDRDMCGDLDRDMCGDLGRDMCGDLDSSLTGSCSWTDDDCLDNFFGFDFDWSI